MNELMTICVIGIVTCTTILTVDTIRYVKAKMMIKSTVRNCFKILEEKDVN